MFVLKKQSVVKPHDAIGRKEEELVLIVVSWMNTQRSLPLHYWLPYPPKYLFIFRADNSLFLYILFLKIHVPSFIDAPLKRLLTVILVDPIKLNIQFTFLRSNILNSLRDEKKKSPNYLEQKLQTGLIILLIILLIFNWRSSFYHA